MEHTTKVRIHLPTLDGIIEELGIRYAEVGHRDTHEGRSRFSAWNNIKKFRERLDPEYKFNKRESPIIVLGRDSESVTIQVVGSAKGNTTRIYYKPSVTSYARAFRECIIPNTDGNQFVFFDIPAAEFFMNCYLCGMTKEVLGYQNGEDLYMMFQHLFPEGTSRAVMKEILISNMYNTTPYRVALKLGITEGHAERLLQKISEGIPLMSNQKAQTIKSCRQRNGYYAFNGFDTTTEIKVAVPKTEFNPELALSSRVQSSLGLFMHGLIRKLDPKINGTLLSVFDSVLVEVGPNSLERYKKFIRNNVAPFRVDSFGTGKTFAESYENTK